MTDLQVIMRMIRDRDPVFTYHKYRKEAKREARALIRAALQEEQAGRHKLGWVYRSRAREVLFNFKYSHLQRVTEAVTRVHQVMTDVG